MVALHISAKPDDQPCRVEYPLYCQQSSFAGSKPGQGGMLPSLSTPAAVPRADLPAGRSGTADSAHHMTTCEVAGTPAALTEMDRWGSGRQDEPMQSKPCLARALDASPTVRFTSLPCTRSVY